MPKSNFEDNLKALGVTWKNAPDIDEIKSIQARVIIGPNGCGKSRLLRALSKTLQDNGVRQTVILYADFPEMASLERKGIDEAGFRLLRNIFLNKNKIRIYDTLKLISSDPVKGVEELIKLSESDEDCENVVDKINGFVKLLLGPSFQWKDFANLFKDNKELSPGQRSMFYMSFMLGVFAAYHADDEWEEEFLYILFDEPDQHLHAKAIVDFTKQLQISLPKAKLWIATHSVHLMAHFKFSDIIFIDSDEVQRNDSLMYEKICETMVDTKEMQQFVSFSGLYGFYEFFRECFEEPKAEGAADDEKLSPIKQRIRGRKIEKILDYGAGKGRFFTLLSDIPGIDYYALEIDPKYHDDLNKLLPPLDMPSSNRLYTQPEEIPDGEFGAVLLINTLHEIPLEEWEDTFDTIKRSLKDDGCLFFCETAPLITGEYIENTGFLVLGVQEQRVLFGGKAENLDERKKLHFSEVPKAKIPGLTKNKLEKTLKALKDNAFKNWELEQASERQNARNTAFYAVQHLNAEQALRQFFGILNIVEEPSSVPVLSSSSAQPLSDVKIFNEKFGGIEWLQLSEPQDGCVLLLSKYVLELRRYNDKKDNTWKGSELQKYLNGAFFIGKFNAEKRERIIKNNDTGDNIFLLNEDEVVKYLKDSSEKRGIREAGNLSVPWWLRSSGNIWNGYASVFVYKSQFPGVEVTTEIFGVRPALWLKLNTEIKPLKKQLQPTKE